MSKLCCFSTSHSLSSSIYIIKFSTLTKSKQYQDAELYIYCNNRTLISVITLYRVIENKMFLKLLVTKNDLLFHHSVDYKQAPLCLRYLLFTFLPNKLSNTNCTVSYNLEERWSEHLDFCRTQCYHDLLGKPFRILAQVKSQINPKCWWKNNSFKISKPKWSCL